VSSFTSIDVVLVQRLCCPGVDLLLRVVEVIIAEKSPLLDWIRLSGILDDLPCLAQAPL